MLLAELMGVRGLALGEDCSGLLSVILASFVELVGVPSPFSLEDGLVVSLLLGGLFSFAVSLVRYRSIPGEVSGSSTVGEG